MRERTEDHCHFKNEQHPSKWSLCVLDDYVPDDQWSFLAAVYDFLQLPMRVPHDWNPPNTILLEIGGSLTSSRSKLAGSMTMLDSPSRRENRILSSEIISSLKPMLSMFLDERLDSSPTHFCVYLRLWRLLNALPLVVSTDHGLTYLLAKK